MSLDLPGITKERIASSPPKRRHTPEKKPKKTSTLRSTNTEPSKLNSATATVLEAIRKALTVVVACFLHDLAVCHGVFPCLSE